MLRRSAVLFAVAGCLAAVVVAGCGSGKNSSSLGGAASSATSSPATSGGGSSSTSGSVTTAGKTNFAKTKFVFHAGLAFGAFHRWIYGPFRAGVFDKPLIHKAATVKAALAARFIYHELERAAVDVRSGMVVRALFAPLTFLVNKLRPLPGAIRSGYVSSAEINAINTGIAGISSSASGIGQTIADKVPSEQQLSSSMAR